MHLRNLLNNISFFENNYLFLTVLGLCCFAWAFSHCGKQGLLFVAVLGLLLWWLLLLQSIGSRCMGSGVVVHGLSCSPAYEIFLDQGLNPCPLYWQADSYLPGHRGSPTHPHFETHTKSGLTFCIRIEFQFVWNWRRDGSLICSQTK